MKNDLNILPKEVAAIAENVSPEKRNEVQSVLNYVFTGVEKMRSQLEVVHVSDENDKVNMELAKTIRLGVKNERLAAEKTFDQKRNEVQQKMLNYKTEDQLWLKAKQTMQILTKELEEIARWKEETKMRYEMELKEKAIAERLTAIQKYCPETQKTEIERLTDKQFGILLGIAKAEFDAEREAEKKAEEKRIARELAEEKERQRIKKENEKLKREAEEKDRKAKLEAEQRAKEEKARQEEQRKEREAYELKIKAERERAAKIEAQERAKREQAEAELAAKREQERKRIEEEKAKEKERQEAEKKSKAAPDKEKLIIFAEMLQNIKIPGLSTKEAEFIGLSAKGLIDKTANYIILKTKEL